jgi:hypothetical protein
MLYRPQQPTHRELFLRADAAKELAHAVRLESRETVARCTESRLALDAARRDREEQRSSS